MDEMIWGASVSVVSVILFVLLVLAEIHKNMGIYGFMHEGKWVYIGKSVDVNRRRVEHLREKRMFSSYQFKVIVSPCPPFLLNRLERHYIKKHKPAHNVLLKK